MVKEVSRASAPDSPFGSRAAERPITIAIHHSRCQHYRSFLSFARISAIMRVLKSRSLQARDSQLYKTVAITILVACLYLTLWSTIDPVAHSLTPNKWAVCDFAWWEVLIVAGRLSRWRCPSLCLTHANTKLLICHSIWTTETLKISFDKGIRLTFTAEVSFLGWGGLLCYRARKAPDLYNESRSVALSIWNEAIWSIVYVFAR